MGESDLRKWGKRERTRRVLGACTHPLCTGISEGNRAPSVCGRAFGVSETQCMTKCRADVLCVSVCVYVYTHTTHLIDVLLLCGVSASAIA